MLELWNEPRLQLIINADDLGYSEDRDRAAFELIGLGVVTGASLLTNMPHSRKAAQRCIDIGFRVGLHINLTQGRPLSGKSSTLTTPDGLFMGKGAFFAGTGQDFFNAEDIYEQISLQFEWFVREFDRLPTHVDGHNHAHMVPQVAQVLATVMEQYGCYKYRLPIEPLKGEGTPFLQTLALFASQSKCIFEKHNMISTGYFVGLELIYSFRLEDLKCALDRIEAARIAAGGMESVYVELMVHPGYISVSSEPHAEEFHSLSDRLTELELLRS